MSTFKDEIEKNRNSVDNANQAWEQTKTLAEMQLECATGVLEVAKKVLHNAGSSKEAVEFVTKNVTNQIKALETLKPMVNKCYTAYASALITETAIVRELIKANSYIANIENKKCSTFSLQIGNLIDKLNKVLIDRAAGVDGSDGYGRLER